MGQRPFRLLLSFVGVAVITFVAYRVVAVNATTVGFAYLLLVLVIASLWGFPEAAFASVLATLVFNFFFFPPVGRFTIADPENWIALTKNRPPTSTPWPLPCICKQFGYGRVWKVVEGHESKMAVIVSLAL